MSESTIPDHRPGACNIGRHQRRQRYRLAAVALFGAVGYLAAVALTDVPTALVLGVFVPSSLGIEWYLQGRRSFCATLGFVGRYEFEDEHGEVSGEDARRADRRYAFRLTVLGLLGGGVLATVSYLVLALS